MEIQEYLVTLHLVVISVRLAAIPTDTRISSNHKNIHLKRNNKQH